MKYLPGLIFPLLFWGICHADIFRVAVETAEIRNRPSSTNSYAVLEAPLYYPLLVKSTQNDFYEVRDYEGNTGWIHNVYVEDQKAVVVKVETVNVRKGPGTNYPVIFKAYKGVAFSVVEEKNDWLKVLHESGKHGWVSKPMTWGQ